MIQPNPATDEWTVERIRAFLYDDHGYKIGGGEEGLASAINAALESAKQDFAKQIAAERQRADRMEKLLRSMSQERVKDYFDLLSAERELAKVGAK